MTKVPALAMAATMLAVLFAGCTSGDAAPAENVDVDNYELAAGKGAISGILVDDRFRPIELGEDVDNQFGGTGFILIQETGAKVQTSVNGEFVVVDVEPGRYTLRVSAEGFEAAPATVLVEEGVFNEIQLMARRIATSEEVIVTEAYAGFATCFVNFVALSMRPNCTPDGSGDSARSGFNLDYTELTGVTWIVAEALFRNEPQLGASYDLTMRAGFAMDHTGAVLWEGKYAKMHIQNGSISPDPELPGETWIPFYAHNTTTTLEMFGRGTGAEEIRTTYEPVYDSIKDLGCIGVEAINYCVNQWAMRRGGGVTLGVQANFLISIFLHEPEVPPHESGYCLLCD